jgi:hypothetical protein
MFANPGCFCGANSSVPEEIGGKGERERDREREREREREDEFRTWGAVMQVLHRKLIPLDVASIGYFTQQCTQVHLSCVHVHMYVHLYVYHIQIGSESCGEDCVKDRRVD